MKLFTNRNGAVALFTMTVCVLGLVMSPASASALFSSSGDTTGAGIPAGNASYHHMFNSTQQMARFQTVLANLSQQGVDVSQALADLAAGNVTGAMKDLMAFHKDHPGMTANTTRQAAQLQTGVTKLAQQGVDVSEVQADIASGNVSAAMQWMAAYHTAHPVQSGNVTGMHSGNSTRWQNGGSFRPHTSGSGNQTAVHHRFRGPVQGAEKTAGASF